MHLVYIPGTSELKTTMASAKYKEYVDLMIQNNKEDFERFGVIHDKYGLNPDRYQEEFNEAGKKIQRHMFEWEDKLCNRSQATGYGNYAGKLAEKFREETKKRYPHIESIGIKVFKLDKIKV